MEAYGERTTFSVTNALFGIIIMINTKIEAGKKDEIFSYADEDNCVFFI